MTRFCCLDYKLMPALEQSGILWEVTKGAKLGVQARGAKSGGLSSGGQVLGRTSPRGAKPRVLG